MAINVDKTMYNGRPDNTREDNEMRCYDVLDKLGIAYDRADHDAADTIDDCHEIEDVLGHTICKNLFLTNRQETQYYLLLLPGDKPFKTKELSKQLGIARLSFAKAEAMEKYLDIHPGSVSVLGVLNDKENHVQLVIDREVLEDEYLCCHPCRNTSTLKLKTLDVLDKILPYAEHTFIKVDLPREEEMV